MERPKIQMMVDDGEEEELVELAAPSADAAIRLKSGRTIFIKKLTALKGPFTTSPKCF